jgi:hypothetical protein
MYYYPDIYYQNLTICRVPNKKHSTEGLFDRCFIFDNRGSASLHTVLFNTRERHLQNRILKQ